MDQYLNNRQNEMLWKLLANPADNGYVYSHNLQQLTSDFPQSGLLQALLARSGKGQNMGSAAASFDPKTLYVLINAYENLAEVSEGQIIRQEWGSENYTIAEEANNETASVVVGDDEQEEIQAITDHFEMAPAAIEAEPATQNEEISETPENPGIHELVSEIPGEDHRAELQQEVFEEEIIEFHELQTDEPIVQLEENKIEPEQLIEIPEEDRRADTTTPVFEEEIIEFHELPADELVTEDIEADAPVIDEESILVEQAQAENSKDIEDDIYDEIVGIESISFTRVNKPAEETIQPGLIEAAGEELADGVVEEPAEKESYDAGEQSGEPEIEELIPESLAGSDFFVFERAEKITQHAEAGEKETPAAEVEVIKPLTNEFKTTPAEKQDLSRYHDEKMPYTFMWWLDKTRKEHAGIYQPFKLDTSQAIKYAGDEMLQQQYYENIFHVTTIEELDQAAAAQAIEFDMKNKEDRIIKKFIAEAPHIGTPTGDKLDNENKAKKSAEDQDELVTETLARIYTDQMLYHKAINTYKKLMLKFPEKSRYFADQIELLERKIN